MGERQEPLLEEIVNLPEDWKDMTFLEQTSWFLDNMDEIGEELKRRGLK